MEKILLSFISALLGFLLSQSFNFVSYLRRPRFRVRHWTNGVASSYTGDPPETPWEIELGFFLENYGKNPAKNTRIFVTDIKGAKASQDEPELTSIELLEIRRPLDFIPSGECVLVKLGTIRGDTCELALDLHTHLDEEQAGMIGADTRGSVHFSAKFYVTCEEKNSFHSLTLEFRPDKDEYASALLEDYTNEYLESVTRPKM
jgi:hypothetical protein